MSILLQNPKSDQLNAALPPSNDPKHPATYVLPQLQWLNSEDASSPPLGYACASGREAEDLLARGVLLPETERNSPTKSIRHKKPQSRWFVEGWMRLTADIFGTHARRKCSENRDGPCSCAQYGVCPTPDKE